MTKRIFLAFLCVYFTLIKSHAQNIPTIAPTATFTSSNGKTETSESFQGSAPINVLLEAKVENVANWTPHYEWRFYLNNANEPYLIRYEENTQYVIAQTGTHKIVLYATFTNGKDVINYTQDYWSENTPITLTVSASKLEMPNGFSPNGDGINDIYKAKEGFQSIISFRAIIYNRWGQKLYQWTDPYSGWDGRYNGKDVKEGVYFVWVEAQGADGQKFTIKRDVNLLRSYTEGSSTTH